MNDTQEIIYSLLYDIETEFIFDISNVVLGNSIEKYSTYVDSVVAKINTGGVYVLKDSIHVDDKAITWHVKVDRF